MNGLIPIHKPADMISKDVSRLLAKILPRKTKLGHVGTLDPMASGVLPMLVGSATRLSDYLLDGPKVYIATIIVGFSTDTLDRTGKVMEEGSSSHISASLVEETLQSFLGTSMQVPPLFSAIKHQGVPLYKAARAGNPNQIDVTEFARPVTLEELRLLEYQSGRFTFEVRCQKGTYIRSLVRDLCEKMHVCGTMGELIRKEACSISLEEAIPLEDVLKKPLTESVIPISAIKLPLPKWRIQNEDAWARLRHGQTVTLAQHELLPLDHDLTDLCFSLSQKQVLLNQDHTENWILATQQSANLIVELKAKRSL